MGRPEDVAKEKQKIKAEMLDSYSSYGKIIDRFINRENNRNKPGNVTSVEDEALTDVINEMEDDDLGDFVTKMIQYKTSLILKFGGEATLENSRVFKLTNEKPKYGLELQGLENNWFIADKIVIYSSRLLYEEDVKKVEAIDKLINENTIIKNVFTKDDKQEIVDSFLQHDTILALPVAMGFYTNGTEVVESKKLDYIDLDVDKEKGTVKVTRIDPDFLKNEIEVHNRVDFYRKSEANAMQILTDRVVADANKNKNVLSSEGIENLSMYMAYCMKQDIGEEIEDCLTEFKIRTEEDYLRRADNLKTLSRDLQNDIDFIGFAKSIQNSEGFTNFTDYMKESPGKIAQKWSKFKTDVIRTRERIKKLPDTLLTLSEESNEKYSKHDYWMSIDEIVDEFGKSIKAANDFEKNKKLEYDNINDIRDTADYFVYRLLSEPGAKRTFFGKGTDFADEEKVRARNTHMVANADGRYHIEDVNRETLKIRNNLVEDPLFKKAMLIGKTRDKVYDEYKRLAREKTNDIKSDFEQSMKRKPTNKKELEDARENTGYIELSEDDVDFFKKTKDELDTLYKSGGKYRSTYMKELYTELKKVIDAADKSMLLDDDSIPMVKKGRLEALQEKAVTYFKERKGSIFNPVTDRGKARLDIVEKLIHKTDTMMKIPENKMENEAPQSSRSSSISF